MSCSGKLVFSLKLLASLQRPLLARGHPQLGLVIPAAQILTHGGFHWVYYAAYPTGHEGRWKTSRVAIFLARFHQVARGPPSLSVSLFCCFVQLT